MFPPHLAVRQQRHHIPYHLASKSLQPALITRLKKSTATHVPLRTWPSASSATTAAVMAASGMSLQLWSIALSWPRGGPANQQVTQASWHQQAQHAAGAARKAGARVIVRSALAAGQATRQQRSPLLLTGDGDGVGRPLHLGAHEAHHLGKAHVALWEGEGKQKTSRAQSHEAAGNTGCGESRQGQGLTLPALYYAKP